MAIKSEITKLVYPMFTLHDVRAEWVSRVHRTNPGELRRGVWARVNDFPRLRGKFFRCWVCTVYTVGSIYTVGSVYTICTVWLVWLADCAGKVCTVYTVWTQGGQQSICYSYSREWMIGPLNLNPTDYHDGRQINVTGAAWTRFSGRNEKSTVSPS